VFQSNVDPMTSRTTPLSQPSVQDLLSCLGKRNLTLLTPRRDDKVVDRLHVAVRSRTQLGAGTLAEEIRRGASQLHPRQVDAETAVGTGAEGAVGRFCFFRLDRVGEVTGWVESAWC